MTRATLVDLVNILEGDPQFGQLTFNEAKNILLFGGRPLVDADVVNLRLRIAATYGYRTITDADMRDAVSTVGMKGAFNPITAYLADVEKKWDGTPRLHGVPSRVMGADPDPIFGRYFELWMMCAVARARQPGVKVDNILVLKGAQGTYKSSFFALLARGPGDGYFTDSPIAVGTKDGMDALAGMWIVEWSEFEDLLRRNASGVIKGFLSSTVDRFRPAYARSIVEVPRRCVICATTNEGELYKDETGSRRFMTIPIDAVDITLVEKEMHQWWGEAAHRLSVEDTPLYLTAEDMVRQSERNKQFLRANSPETCARVVKERILSTSQLWPGAQQQDTPPGGEVVSYLGMSISLPPTIAYDVLRDNLSDLPYSNQQIARALRDLGYESFREYEKGVQKRVWRKT